jgi:polysaccharide export outer membrane protein
MPDYVIEPPDVLTINALNITPLPPYRLSSLDVINIQVNGTPEDRPIQGPFPVEPGGVVQLGFDYGIVKVGGLTIQEVKDTITEHLKALLRAPEVFVSLAQIRAEQDVAGEHLVAADGKVNLGTYGRVRVVGMTMEEATEALVKHLSQYLEDPKISLDVFGYNSKVFYIITQGADLGDQAVAIPFKGNETVLDAITQINGLSPFSSLRMWVARPGRNQSGGDQILPIDWLAISQRAATETNYQLLPGDRIFIAEDPFIALDNRMGKILAPWERLLGQSLFLTSVIARWDFYDRSGQGFFGF